MRLAVPGDAHLQLVTQLILTHHKVEVHFAQWNFERRQFQVVLKLQKFGAGHPGFGVPVQTLVHEFRKNLVVELKLVCVVNAQF